MVKNQTIAETPPAADATLKADGRTIVGALRSHVGGYDHADEATCRDAWGRLTAERRAQCLREWASLLRAQQKRAIDGPPPLPSGRRERETLNAANRRAANRAKT